MGVERSKLGITECELGQWTWSVRFSRKATSSGASRLGLSHADVSTNALSEKLEASYVMIGPGIDLSVSSIADKFGFSVLSLSRIRSAWRGGTCQRMTDSSSSWGAYFSFFAYKLEQEIFQRVSILFAVPLRDISSSFSVVPSSLVTKNFRRSTGRHGKISTPENCTQ